MMPIAPDNNKIFVPKCPDTNNADVTYAKFVSTIDKNILE